MNTLRLSLAILVLAAANVHAGESAAPIALKPVPVSTFRVVVDCASRHLPKANDVAKLVDTYNMWQTHAAAERLLWLAKEPCARGADFVQFVPSTQEASQQRFAMVEVSKSP
jgi:hypothetical protein